MRLQIDIVSDTVCPWCYIGQKRFARAVARFGHDAVNVVWRPYQLDPTIPPEGMDRKAYLRQKFGEGHRPKEILQALEQAAASEGLLFEFDAIKRSPNTLDSHRLIRWALSAGCQDQVVGLLFEAYFEHGLDIGDTNVLTQIAAQAGMDSRLVADLLSGDADKDLVRREIATAREMGIRGVPTFIIDQRYAVSGAQESDTLLSLMQEARKTAAGSIP